MPYIKKQDREALDKAIAPLASMLSVRGLGDLNYVITKLVIGRARSVHYSEMATWIGTLECAKLELYRRMVAPYEDKKKEENGDVY